MTDLIVESKTYNLSTRSGSCNLLNGEYKSNVEYSIPDMIYKDDSIEYIQYSIPYVVIPVSFYQINETNNTIHLLYNGEDIIITFDFGNYNANQFIKEFFNVLPASDGWNITLDVVNSIFTITNTTFSFTFLGDSLMDYVIGYNDTINSQLTNGVNTIKMPRPCNFLPLPKICIRCPQLSNQGNMKDNVNSSDIIMSVPNNAKQNGQIAFKNIYSKIFLQADRIEKLNIQFTDDDGRFINFNGISCFFVIQFDIFRKNLGKPPSFSQLKTLANNSFSV